MSDVVYVYGFVPAGSAAPEPDLPGIGGAAVELVGLGRFQGVISRVSAERYAPERIEARLDDLRWVGDHGLAHERVVAWFVDRGDIVPVPLFTFYSGLDALREETAGRSAVIAERLARFAGRHQWDIKVGYRADAASAHAAELSTAVRALEDDIASAEPGRRYLLERKRADLVREEVAGAVRSRAHALLEALQRFAEDVVLLPLPPADRELPVVLFAALLVAIDAERSFVEEAERLARENEVLGIDLGFSGPWAPYRFIGDVDD
ncbi:MAG: GvpL/GvpF family gas vesicle protein [Longimicrobiales bacterium]